MSRTAIIGLRIVAVATCLMAGLGAFYTLVVGYFTILGPAHFDAESPYFRQAYYAMASICLAFYVLLLYLGVQFWRLRTELRFWFLGILIAELVYFLVVGSLWRLENEKIALSIAAATGVANGGLSIQGITLFPIWATAIVFWVHSSKTGMEPGAHAPDQPAG